MSLSPHIPKITNENTAIEYIRTHTGKVIENLEEYETWMIQNVWIYRPEEWKKEFSISTVRRCIEDISLAPYDGYNIYVLYQFDTASPEAQNAILKTLEDCPVYAIILLVVEHHESLLETIHSRCQMDDAMGGRYYSDPSLDEMVDDWISGRDSAHLVSYIYSGKYEKSEAISIIRAFLLRYPSTKDQEFLTQWLIDIFSTNEPVKNILERVLFCEIHHT